MRAVVALLLGGFFSFPPGTAQAHPHAWIDLTVRVLFDDMGRARALEENWLFDDYYTVFVTEGATLNKDGSPDQASLDAVMKENMKNLAAYHYFTEVRSGDVPVEIGTATDTSTRMDKGRLALTFVVPFKVPVTVTDMPLRYALFDPSYYIEMLHAEVPHPVTLVGAPAGCAAELIKPNPNPDQVMLAAALDRSQSGGNGLGKFFSEEVRVTCGQ